MDEEEDVDWDHINYVIDQLLRGTHPVQEKKHDKKHKGKHHDDSGSTDHSSDGILRKDTAGMVRTHPCT
jgi:hypothetical protein